MEGTLITLVSDQVVPIALGAMYDRPKHIIYLCSDNPRHQTNIDVINHYLLSHFSFTYEKVFMAPFDLEKNLHILRQLMVPTEETRCNITGGTKLMAIAAYQVMREKKVPTFYVDTANERLILFGESKEDTEYVSIPKLTVADFVRLIGAETFREQTDLFAQEWDRLDKLSSLIVRNPAKWNEVNKFFHSVAKRNRPFFEVDASVHDVKRSKADLQVDVPFLNQLKEAGWLSEVIHSGGKVRFAFSDKVARDVLFNHGLWLEFLVYRTLKESKLMDDICAGVEIVWNREDLLAEHMVKNEIDVLATRASQLFGFSCKSGSNLDVTKALNEIDLYTRKLGGLYYKAALVVSGRKLNETEHKRAKEMRVRIFNVADPHVFQDELTSWITSSVGEGSEVKVTTGA